MGDTNIKVLMIEPHGDDALLSCLSFIKKNNVDIDLITFSDRESEGLFKHYSSIVSTHYYRYPSLGYTNGKPYLETHAVHRGFKNGDPIYDNYTEFIRDHHSTEYKELFDKMVTDIDNYLSRKDYDLVVSPSGLVQPHHVLVRQSVDEALKNKNIPVLYYADKYYIQNRYAKEMYESMKLSMKSNNSTEIEINPGYSKYQAPNQEVYNMMEEIYPTELKLFRFYSDIIMNVPCKYFCTSIIKDERVRDLINSLNENME